MADTIDRDNTSTLLLAIITLKHITAYSKPLYTAPQIIICRLQFNYGKKLSDFTLCGACMSISRLSRR